jgi:hypothetical protein
VVVLDCEVEESEPVGGGLGESRSDHVEDVVPPERRKTDTCPERHVHRTARIVRRPEPVRHTAPAGPRLPPRPIPAPAPCRRRRERQLSRRAPHLEWADIILSLLACQATGATRRTPRGPRLRSPSR